MVIIIDKMDLWIGNHHPLLIVEFYIGKKSVLELFLMLIASENFVLVIEYGNIIRIYQSTDFQYLFLSFLIEFKVALVQANNINASRVSK